MSDEEFVAALMHFSRMMFEWTVTAVVLSIIWFVITGRISYEGAMSASAFAACGIIIRVLALTEDTCDEDEEETSDE